MHNSRSRILTHTCDCSPGSLHFCMLRMCLTILAVALFMSTGSSVQAVTSHIDIGDVSVRIYAPDWIWQGQAVNILIVAENRSDAATSLTVRLHLPDHTDGELQYDSSKRRVLRLATGTTVRTAFTRLVPTAGFPLREYTCTLEFDDGVATVRTPCVFRTVRGPAVAPGIWSALIPVGITLIWCFAVLAMLPRLAVRGAWKASSPVFDKGE